jgi:hypothetical protein
MSELEHLSAESLQGYVEGAIGDADRAVLESHLAACTRCSSELEEWRSLFTVLASLPQLSPAAGFADRVMSRVKVRAVPPFWAEWLASARQLAQRLTPRTAGAWALASAFIALPLLVGGGVMTWLISKDYVTAQSLWVFLTDRTASGMQSLGASALSSLLETSVVSWLVAQAESLLATAGARGLGALAVGVGGLTMASIWILYRNLFRTPTRETNHVSYTF